MKGEGQERRDENHRQGRPPGRPAEMFDQVPDEQLVEQEADYVDREDTRPAVMMPVAALTVAQSKAIGDFVKVADAMAAALSADDLAAFNKASEPAMMQSEALITALSTNPEWKPKLDALDKARHFHGFDNIKKARVAFHAFSTATTALIEPLRTAKGAPDFKVWECFMVDQIIPNVPAKGHWLQISTRAGHNPFFGKDMLECVKEIKPGEALP